MPDLVVWPESSLNIALFVKFKMEPFDQGKQNSCKHQANIESKYVVGGEYIHHPKCLYWRGGRGIDHNT